MQRVLTFTVDKKKYTSKPFDFEAFRLTNENHADDTKKGAVTCGMDGVYHLFACPRTCGGDPYVVVPVKMQKGLSPHMRG